MTVTRLNFMGYYSLRAPSSDTSLSGASTFNILTRFHFVIDPIVYPEPGRPSLRLVQHYLLLPCNQEVALRTFPYTAAVDQLTSYECHI